MRLVKSVLAVVLFGALSGACFFNDQPNCDKNSYGANCSSTGSGTGSGSGSGTGGATDSTTTTVPTACSKPSDCESTFCVHGICCDSECKGLCQTCASGTCSQQPVGYRGADAAACEDHGGCGEVAGHCRCDDGVADGDEADVDCGGLSCPKCPIGAACPGDAAGSDCASGFCVDQHCCDVSAAECGTCWTCNNNASPGICAPVAPGSEDGACGSASVCSADGECALDNEQSNCKSSSASCHATDQCCASDRCVSNGGTTKCSSCSDDNDCGGVRRCVPSGSTNFCIYPRGLGESCQTDTWCADNRHCVDGVCCDSECTGACMACQYSYTGHNDGECRPISQGLDPHNECNGPGTAATCSGHAVGSSQSLCGFELRR